MVEQSELAASSAPPARPSPSPRPSPSGRGRSPRVSYANWRRHNDSTARLRFSLSLRERAGVRGKWPWRCHTLRAFANTIESRKTSWHPLPPPQAPLRDKTSQGKSEHGRRVPNGECPGLHHRRMAVRQAASELLELVCRNNFSARFARNIFKQRQVRSQRTELFGGQIGRPSCNGSAHFRAE